MINSLSITNLSSTELDNLYVEIKKTNLKLSLVGTNDSDWDVEILGLENELNSWLEDNTFWLEWVNAEPVWTSKEDIKKTHYVDERLRNLPLTLVRKDFDLDKNIPIYFFTSPNKVYVWYTNSLDYQSISYGKVSLSGTVKAITDSHVVLTRCKLQ